MQLILQKKTNGVTDKTWKLTSKKNLHVAGCSKKADIYIPSVNNPVWLGFEYRDNKWFILNLAGEGSQNFIEKAIGAPLELNYSNFSIEIFPVTMEFEFISQENSNVSESSDKGVILLESDSGRVISSLVLSRNAFDQRYPSLIPATHWQSFSNSRSGQIWFYKETPLHTELAQDLKREPREKDPVYRYLQSITLFTLFLGLSFYLAMPSEMGASEVALSSVPPKAIIREVRTELRKRPKVQQAKSGSARPDTSTSSTKSVAAGQSAFGSSSRIAQMIARISNQNVASKNVVIVKNAKLGESSGTVSASSVADQLGGSAKGLGQVGGTTTGVKVGTLSNQNANGSGSGRGLASVAGGLSGSGGSAAASALEEEADVEGGLDPEVIASFIRSRLGEILYCYERQLSANPNLYGKVGVKFIIGGNGFVESTRVFQSSLQNATVEGCIAQKIGKWKFPTPKGGTQVVVTYPFMFKNTN